MKYILSIILICLFSLSMSEAKTKNMETSLFGENRETRATGANTNELELGKRYLKLGNTYREAGDIDKATEFLNLGQRIVNKYNTWDSRYWRAVADEFWGYLYRDINMLDLSKNKFKSAINQYSGLIAQDDGSQFALDLVLQNIHLIGLNSGAIAGLSFGSYETVTEYIAKKQYPMAIRVLDGIINSNPDDAMAYYLRALLKEKLADNISAQSDYNMAYMLNSLFQPRTGISNPIIYDSMSDALKEADKVQFLNLESQGLTSFPLEELRRFPNLVSLNLRYNGIENIPSGISNLNKLQVLIMDGNPFGSNSIPDELGSLKNLKQLSLRYIYLEPNDIVKLCKVLPGETKIIF